MKPAPSQTTPDASLQLDRENPYPGLHPFQEQDNSYFFGRNRERNELFRLVARDVITVLFGRSGLGKTSLLNAGLFPDLRAKNYLPIPIRLGFDPRQADFTAQVRASISNELTNHHVDARPPDPHETLWEYFHRETLWDRRNHLLTPVLVFDQFEEIFTLGRNDERLPDLLTELADLIENRIPLKVREQMATFENEEIPFDYSEPGVKVILSLREDYLGYLDDLRSRIPSIDHNHYRLLPLHGNQALDAVIEPARGLATKDAAEQIVRFVAGASLKDENSGESVSGDLQQLEIESSLLSLVCRELNERRMEQDMESITPGRMKETGSQILTEFYQRSVEGLDPGIVVFIEKYLLTESGFRNSMAVDNALAQDGVTESSLNQLINRRLLRREEHLGIPHVELIHDVLIPVILESRSKRRQKEEEQKRHRAEKEVEQTRRKRLRLIAGLGILISGLVLIAYWYQYNISQQLKAHNEKIEVGNEIIAQHTSLIALQKIALEKQNSEITAQSMTFESIVSIYENKPVRALLLAKKAFLETYEPQPMAVEALQRSIQNTRQRFVYEHGDDVLDIAISSDGKHLAIAGKNGEVALWDTVDNRLINTLQQDNPVRAIAFDPGGARIVTTSGNKVLLWDAASGDRLNIILAGHDDLIESVQFSPDGRWIATASRDNTARLWNSESGEMLEEYKHDSWVLGVAFSPDGSTLATASLDKTAILWDITSGAWKLLDKRTTRINAVAFSPDGTQIATAGGEGDETIKVWDASTRKLLHTLAGHKYQVRGIAYSAEGHLASASEDRTIRMWNTLNGVELFRLDGHRGRIYTVIFDPTGQQLYSGSTDKSVRVWDVMHNGAVFSVDFSPDGKTLATGSEDHTARLWSLESGKQVTALNQHQSRIYKVKFSPDGVRLATASWDNTAGIWNLKTGSLDRKLGGKHTYNLMDIDFSPDGEQLATAGGDGRAFVWNVRSGEPLLLHQVDHPEFSHNKKQVHGVAFSPLESDHHLATAGWDKHVFIWDSRTGARKQKLPSRGENYGGFNAVAFSPDGKLLATADTKKKIKLWDVDSGELIRTLLGHETYINEILFSPDGKRLASGGGDKQAIIWDVATDKKPLSLKHPEEVHDAAFSPDGKLLATACANGRFYLYPIDNKDVIKAAEKLIHQCRDEKGEPCEWYAPTD